jgi:hypothetical protein
VIDLPVGPSSYEDDPKMFMEWYLSWGVPLPGDRLDYRFKNDGSTLLAAWHLARGVTGELTLYQRGEACDHGALHDITVPVWGVDLDFGIYNPQILSIFGPFDPTLWNAPGGWFEFSRLDIGGGGTFAFMFLGVFSLSQIGLP